MKDHWAGWTTRLAPWTETPDLDLQVLLGQVLGRSRAWVLAHPEVELTASQQVTLEAVLRRLEDGEPLPYVLGRREFFGLEFEVTPDVLIPRPETELLVEHAIPWLKARVEVDWNLRALDVGTGSGCIAVALAVNVPALQVVATDISPAALEVARHNAGRLGVAERIEFHCCDLLPSFEKGGTVGGMTPSPFDLIVANLPYIPTRTLHDLPVYGREPTLALDGGEDGLDLIRRLLGNAPDWLSPGGRVLLEIEASRGQAALSLACDAFEEARISLHQDLAGRDRLVEIQDVAVTT